MAKGAFNEESARDFLASLSGGSFVPTAPKRKGRFSGLTKALGSTVGRAGKGISTGIESITEAVGGEKNLFAILVAGGYLLSSGAGASVTVAPAELESMGLAVDASGAVVTAGTGAAVTPEMIATIAGSSQAGSALAPLVAGTAIDAYGAYRAGEATEEAAGTYQAATGAAIEEQKRQYDVTREDFAPWREAGVTALGELEGREFEFSPDEYLESDIFQNQLARSLKSAQRKLSATGYLGSGAEQAELQRVASGELQRGYGEEYKRQFGEYGTDINKLSRLAGLGETSTARTAAAGAKTSADVGDYLTRQGEVGAGAVVGKANIETDFLNRLGKNIGYYYGNQ